MFQGTVNGSGLGDDISTLAKNHGYSITSDTVCGHVDFLGQNSDLTDFELEMTSGGLGGRRGNGS